MEKKNFEFIVVGGGMAGICAAIAASRKVKTALVQNRPGIRRKRQFRNQNAYLRVRIII